MSNVAILDSRGQSLVKIQQKAGGIDDVITWVNIPTLDTEYTISIGGNTYNVGSGITLNTVPVNSIAWSLNKDDFSDGVTEGYLESESQVAGIYFRSRIKLERGL